jgi:hypothetical protein
MSYSGVIVLSRVLLMCGAGEGFGGCVQLLSLFSKVCRKVCLSRQDGRLGAPLYKGTSAKVSVVSCISAALLGSSSNCVPDDQPGGSFEVVLSLRNGRTAST